MQRLLLLLGLGPGALAVKLHERDATASASLGGDIDNCTYADLYPRQYIAYKTTRLSPEVLDGNLEKPVWAEVDWTQDFVDISTGIGPMWRTRAKIRWDDKYLYVAAQLDDPKAWATLKEDDTVIYYDNDFEVFVDPNGSTHFYKEYEMNAFNARWSLCLNRPYSDGGGENSTRVDKQRGWSMLPRSRSAVRVVPEGTLNDPHKESRYWTVEVALPLADLMYNNSAEAPHHGSFWRLGFSRVQWALVTDAKGDSYRKQPSCQSCPHPGAPNEDNWVWSSQGEINMHLPERWGIVQFSEGAPGTTPLASYNRWPSQAAAMAVYYAQKAYAQAHNGSFASNPQDLLPFTQRPFQLCNTANVSIEVKPPKSSGAHPTYTAAVQTPEGGPWIATVTDDRYLTVAVAGKHTSGACSSFVSLIWLVLLGHAFFQM